MACLDSFELVSRRVNVHHPSKLRVPVHACTYKRHEGGTNGKGGRYSKGRNRSFVVGAYTAPSGRPGGADVLGGLPVGIRRQAWMERRDGTRGSKGWVDSLPNCLSVIVVVKCLTLRVHQAD